MKLDLDYNNRQIIPRWLPFQLGLLLNKQKKIKPDTSAGNDIFHYEKIKAEWRLNKTVSFAIQLVATADILDFTEDEEYKEALLFINKHKTVLSDNKLLEDFFTLVDDREDYYTTMKSDNSKSIREIKTKLSFYIYDPILWIDLAYYYTISRCKKKADKCIRIALSLNNYNPHIIRSAVRYLVFCQEPEKALDLLRKTPNLLYNPLLLSAEISVAEAFKIKTNNIKKGVTLIQENKFPPNDLAELNASIATIECNFGNVKKSKKYINNALVEPNENILAQIQYLSNRNDMLFSPQQYEVPCRFEADAYNYFYSYRYKDVISEARKWLDFHPFSSRPAILSSFVNSTFFDEYEDAISIIDESLKISAGNSLLLNNKAFALAKSGRTEEAVDCIKSIQISGSDEFDDADKNTLKATLGLIEYKKGNPAEGYRLYKEAADYFSKNGYLTLQARALFFCFEEEEKFNKENAQKILSQIIDITKKNDLKEIKILLENKLNLINY